MSHHSALTFDPFETTAAPSAAALAAAAARDEPYPRPQLQRSHWLSLDGPWRFTFDNDKRYRQPGDIERWPQQIVVPYPPESEKKRHR